VRLAIIGFQKNVSLHQLQTKTSPNGGVFVIREMTTSDGIKEDYVR
jgi:hypothetical protein